MCGRFSIGLPRCDGKPKRPIANRPQDTTLPHKREDDMATTLIHESDISKVEPTRQRPGDVKPSYSEALAADLRERIEGEVRFSDGDRALYATDGSNYRQAPIGVVIPKSIDDVVATVAMARKYGAPILSRG